MATNFPGSVDSFPRPTSTTNTNDPGLELDVVIDNLSDALEAVETKVLAGGGALMPTLTKAGTWSVSYLLQTPVGSAWPIIDRAYFTPFIFGEALSITAMSIYVTGAGNAGNVVRLALFRDAGFAPGALIEQGTVAGDSTGAKTLTLAASAAFAAGEVFWIGAAPQGTGSPGSTWMSLGVPGLAAMDGEQSASWSASSAMFGLWPRYLTISGAFTSNPTVILDGNGTRIPMIAVRRA